MKKLILIITLIFFSSSLLALDTYERAKVIKILEKIDNKDKDSTIDYTLKTAIEIKSGKFKGKRVIINHPYLIEKGYNVYYKSGDKVLLLIESETEEESNVSYTIIDIDKRGQIISLFLILFIFVVILGKWQGLKAILALLTVIGLILYIFIPLISKGFSPIFLSISLSALGSLITVFFIAGKSKKALVAFLGTVAGVTVSGILSFIYIKTMRLSGYSTLEILYAADILENVKIKELISAGVIIGSLGAVMDVAMSIASSLEEIKKSNNNITEKEMIDSGLNIGKDIIGTMVNTLILAYLGSSMATILLFSMQGSSFPLIRIFNFEFIASEILRAVCGSIGILVAVPISSILAAKIYHKI